MRPLAIYNPRRDFILQRLESDISQTVRELVSGGYVSVRDSKDEDQVSRLLAHKCLDLLVDHYRA